MAGLISDITLVSFVHTVDPDFMSFMRCLYLVLTSPSILPKCSLSEEIPHQVSSYLLNP
jgi:hypothetical protein